jgi:hypothetical protein
MSALWQRIRSARVAALVVAALVVAGVAAATAIALSGGDSNPQRRARVANVEQTTSSSSSTSTTSTTTTSGGPAPTVPPPTAPPPTLPPATTPAPPPTPPCAGIAGESVHVAPDPADAAAQAVHFDGACGSGTIVHVQYDGGNPTCWPLRRVDVAESAEEVRITLWVGSASGDRVCDASLHRLDTAVTLASPLGSRRVVSGV